MIFTSLVTTDQEERALQSEYADYQRQELAAQAVPMTFLAYVQRLVSARVFQPVEARQREYQHAQRVAKLVTNTKLTTDDLSAIDLILSK